MAGPGGVETGRVFVKIAPRFDEFRTELKTELTKISESKKYQVKVDAVPAFAKFKEELAARLKVISQQAKVKINIQADTNGLLMATRAKLKPLDNRLNLKVNVTPDFKQFSALYKKGLIDAGNSLHADLGTLGKVTFDATPLEDLKNQSAQVRDQIKRDFEAFKNESKLASSNQAAEFKKLQGIELEAVRTEQRKELEEIKNKNRSALLEEKSRYKELGNENKKLSKRLKDDFNGVQKHISGVFGALQSSLGKIAKFSAFSVLGAIAASSIQSVAALGALGIAAVQASIGIAGVAVGLAAISGIGIGGIALAFKGISESLGSLINGDMDSFNKSLEKLTPSAREFVKAFLPFKSIGRVIQEVTFDGLSQKMKEVVKLVGVDLKGAAVSVGNTFNKSIGLVLDKLKDPSILSSLKNVLGNATTNLDKLASIPATLAASLLRVGDAAGNATSSLTDKLVSAADRFGAKIQEKFDNGELEKAIDNGLHVAGQLLQTVVDIGAGIKNIFQAAAAGSKSPLGQFAEDFRTLTENPEVKKGISDFFVGFGAALKPVMTALGELATNVFPAIGDALIDIAPSFTGLFETLGPVLGDLVEQLSPVISSIAEGLQPVILALRPALGAFSDILVKISDALSPIVTKIAEQLAPAIKGLTPAVNPLGDALLSLVEPLGDLLKFGTQVVSLLVEGLSPVIQGLATPLNILSTALSGVGDWLQKYSSWISPIVTAIGAMVVAFYAVELALLVAKGAAIAYTAVQWLLNIALDANPIGLVILAIGALTFAFTELILHGDEILNFFNSSNDAVKALGVSIGILDVNSVETSSHMSGLAQSVGLLGESIINPAKGAADLGAKIGGLINPSEEASQAAVNFGNSLRTMSNSTTPAGTAFRNLAGNVGVATNSIIKSANQIPGIGRPIGQAINFFRDLASEAVNSANNVSKAVGGIAGIVNNMIQQINAVSAISGGTVAPISASIVEISKGASTALKATKAATSGYKSYGSAAKAAGNQASKGSSAAKKAIDAATLANRKFTDSLNAAKNGTRGTVSQITAQFKALNSTIYGLKKPASTKIALLNISKSIGRGLINLANQRADLEKRITATDKVIKDLMDKRAKLATAIAESVGKGFNSVGDLLLKGLGGNAIAKTLGNQLKIVQNFRDKLILLMSKGVDPVLIEQISQMGAQDGLKAATQLLKSTPAQLAAINAQQKALTDELAKVGNTVAGSLYDQGIQAAQGLKNGLLSQLGQVNAAAVRLGNALLNAMRKTLGIHSPSTKAFDLVGVPTGQGVIGGVLSTKSQFDKAMADYTTFKAGDFPGGTAIDLAASARGANGELTGNLYLSTGEFLGVVKGAVNSVNDKEAKSLGMGQRVY